jgi:hypothetical protein
MSELVSCFAGLQLADLGGVAPCDEVEMYEAAYKLMYYLVPGHNQCVSHKVCRLELYGFRVDMLSLFRFPEAGYESSCLVLAGRALKEREKFSSRTEGKSFQCVALHQAVLS